jgi:protoporphyrinogen oxidase
VESKFSLFAEEVSAVWMWKKLVLRGGTRDARGREQLAYFKGGFGRLASALTAEIRRLGGDIRYNTAVTGAVLNGDRLDAVIAGEQTFRAKQFLLTPSFSLIADILQDVAPSSWIESLRRVNYLGNVCLVLMLDRSLSDTYWLNVNDPGFPFVGVIEHTNFDNSMNYSGRRIVFLSRYVASNDPIWAYDDERYLDFAVPYLERMFPAFRRSWIRDYRVWRAAFAQPVTERNYSQYVPPHGTPFDNATIFTMAQIYPEDRGTNYAVREGRLAATEISRRLGESVR